MLGLRQGCNRAGPHGAQWEVLHLSLFADLFQSSAHSSILYILKFLKINLFTLIEG